MKYRFAAAFLAIGIVLLVIAPSPVTASASYFAVIARNLGSLWNPDLRYHSVALGRVSTTAQTVKRAVQTQLALAANAMIMFQSVYVVR